MKSLQNKLNLIKEGKGNKELFLKEARIMFPNVVTGALTFDQAIHNLTERGILSEGFIGVSAKKQDTPDWFKIFNENVKADLKSVDKDVEKLETTGYDYKEVKDSNNLSMEAILSGYYAEMKDPKNAEKTEAELKEMVVKNLTKDPLHYMKDGAFGVKGAGYTDEHPGLGKPKEVTGKFKSSGMEPVKLNESMYGDSDGDYEHDLEMEVRANEYYDRGMEAYSEGDFLKADRYYKAALKAGAWLGWDESDLPPYGDKHLEEKSEINEVGMFHDPRMSSNFKDVDDQWENGAYHVRFRMLKNKGVDEEKAKELAGAYENKPWKEVKKLLNLNELASYNGMSKEEAMSQAEKNSLEGYVQHVEDNGDGTYSVSDWYDSDKTVASYENGMPLNENEKVKKAIMPNKKKGVADQIDIKSALEKIIQKAWAERDLITAKNMVKDFLKGTNINADSKNTMIKNIDDAKSKPRLDQYLANSLLAYEKLKVTEALAEAKHPMEKAVREIEKKSELAKAEAKVNQIQELISELEAKLTMTEAEGVSDMVDKKKVKEIQRNIKFLEAKKKRYDKEKARLEGKYGEKKKEIMDEVEEPKKTMGYKDAVKEMLKRKGLKY